MRRTVRFGIALVAAVALLTSGCGGDAAGQVSAAPLTVTTDSGRLSGAVSGPVRTFLGVRYAQPPTGDRRWSLPRPLIATTRSTDATEPGAPCPQRASLPGARPSTDEDCLFLNITTPRDLRRGERLPVMVWWHGGGFVTGSGADYGAQRLASRGRVMVVTVNYRLGVFGYFGLPGLRGSGNFGFADQLEAVRWTRKNAHAFGGDARGITVFGQSSGGMSACALLTSPRARALADRVAIMSGSCGLNWFTGALYPGSPPQTPYIPLARAESEGAAAAARLGCKGAGAATCLRKKPAAHLLKLDTAVADQLAYGTELLPVHPERALRDGRFARVPVLVGGVRDEARAYVAGAERVTGKAITDSGYPRLITDAYGRRRASAVAAAYPPSRYLSPGVAWATVVTDASWSCPTLATQRALAAHTDAYGYEFADPDPPNVTGVTAPSVPHAAGHATDLPFLFEPGGANLLTTPAQRLLSARMIDYWTSFARHGEPVARGGPRWRPATESSSAALRLAPARIGPVDLAREHRCALWTEPTDR
ncbi:carboxylesterase/lipase family protein [Streptomyces sp. NPDC020965]|uniref:carboxylesterase/lipase family protein n=1 Tax=Streptomyces sp. NPDC020965 TaxID=3365105 RepID=UPI0037B298F7